MEAKTSDKIRIRVLVAAMVEYDVPLSHYGDVSDLGEIVRLEREAAEEDTLALLSEENVHWSITAIHVPTSSTEVL